MILANHPCQASLCRRLSSWIWKPMNLHADYLRSMQGWKMKAICCSGSNTLSIFITALHHHLPPSWCYLQQLIADKRMIRKAIRLYDSVMTYPWHFQQQFWTLCNRVFPKSTKRLDHCPLSAMESGFGCHAARGWLWCAMLSWFFVLLLVVSKVKKGGKVKQDWRKWTKYRQNMTTGINISMMFVKMFVRCQKGHPACAKVSWKAPSNCE